MKLQAPLCSHNTQQQQQHCCDGTRWNFCSHPRRSYRQLQLSGATVARPSTALLMMMEASLRRHSAKQALNKHASDLRAIWSGVSRQRGCFVTRVKTRLRRKKKLVQLASTRISRGAAISRELTLNSVCVHSPWHHQHNINVKIITMVALEEGRVGWWTISSTTANNNWTTATNCKQSSV